MSDKGKYSVVIQAKSGDRVLTEVIYPEQNYSEFVSCQYAIAMGLFNSGAVRAEVKGNPLPPEVIAAMTGKAVTDAKPGPVRPG